MQNSLKLLFLFSLLFCCNPSPAQSSITVGKKAVKLVKVLESIHYYPIKTDKDHALQFIDQFMETLDPTQIYFFADDQNQLNQYSDSLATDLETYSNKLIEMTTDIYKKRLNTADSLIATLLQQPFNYNLNERFYIEEGAGTSRFNTPQEFEDEWRRILKARILRELFTPKQDTINRFSISNEKLLTNEQEAIEKVLIKSKRRIKKIREYPEGFNTYIESAYLNAIAATYDPHTNYFTPEKKNEFEESLSRDQYGFGFTTVENKDGAIEIDGISFGGPAWHTDKLETGDILLKIQPAGKDEIDLTYFDNEYLWEILGSDSYHVIEFTVRKKDNQIVTQRLSKEKIESANYVRSFLLIGKKKVGYIYLPGFYTSFELNKGTGCALDLMREIIKLQNEKIEGLILDLRRNGGGSIDEAVEIASTFIPEGTFVKLSKRGLPDELLEKTSTGISYNDPLVVLVDQSSASASELLAGVLQIYNRAIIVGTNTFGKFTGQIVLPLNREMTNQYSISNTIELGYIKVTIERSYLANGISYQKLGITPDIQLPFPFTNDKSSEAGLNHALQPDTINQLPGFSPMPELPVESLAQKSQERVTLNRNFRTITALINDFKQAKHLYKRIELQIDSFRTDFQTYDHLVILTDSIGKYSVTEFEVGNTNYAQNEFQRDENKKKINEKIVKGIKRDSYIEESFLILCDLIDLLKAKEE